VIYAVETGDIASTEKGEVNVADIGGKVAALLGTDAAGSQIKELTVNPLSGTTYLSVARGKTPVIVQVTRSGKISEFALDKVKATKVSIPGTGKPKEAPKGKFKPSDEVITHMAYVGGRVIVAGMSTEEFASKLRAFPYPFDKTDPGTTAEIYHGAHGKIETNSPVRVFATYKINGEENILAAYTCTPLVKFPVADLKVGSKIKGTTVAELGNRNRPLSMIVYNKGGKDYVLMANNSRGTMKIALDGIDTIEGITSKVSDTAGLKYETVADLKGVMKLDAFDKDHALVLISAGKGKYDLKAVPLP